MSDISFCVGLFDCMDHPELSVFNKNFNFKFLLLILFLLFSTKHISFLSLYTFISFYIIIIIIDINFTRLMNFMMNKILVFFFFLILFKKGPITIFGLRRHWRLFGYFDCF